MTKDILDDLMLADLLGGVVNAIRNEAGAIIGYGMSEFGSNMLEFDEAAKLYGEGVA